MFLTCYNVKCLFCATLYALSFSTDLRTLACLLRRPNSVFSFVFRKCLPFPVRMLIKRNHDQVKLETRICVSYFKTPFFPREIYIYIFSCMFVLNRTTIVTSLTFGFKLSNETENNPLLSFSSRDIFAFPLLTFLWNRLFDFN